MQHIVFSVVIKKNRNQEDFKNKFAYFIPRNQKKKLVIKNVLS